MPSSRLCHAEVEEQDLAFFACREGNRALACDAHPVASGEDGVADDHLALDNVKPSTARLAELVNHVLPGVEHGRADQRVLVNVQRSPPAVGRGDDTQSASTLGRAEALLLMPGLAR